MKKRPTVTRSSTKSVICLIDRVFAGDQSAAALQHETGMGTNQREAPQGGTTMLAPPTHILVADWLLPIDT